MRRPAIRRTLAVVLVAALLTSLVPATNALGAFGTVATSSTAGIVGVLKAPAATPAIGWLDSNTDNSVATTEAIVLGMAGSLATTVGVNDIILSPGTGLTGAAGTVISSPPTGTLDFISTAGTLDNLLRFVDTLPTYANGGPDGKFNPGEPLFLDLDNSGTPNSNDRLLVTGTGVSGSAGGAVSGTQSESTWDAATAPVECIYQGTSAAAVAVGMRRLNACAAGVSGSVVAGADGDLGAVLTTISGLVASFPATRTGSTGTGGTTINDKTVTTQNAFFLASDVGAAISGTSIPTGAWITSFTSTTSVEISVDATATSTAFTVTVTPTGGRIVPDGITVLGDATVTSGTNAFTVDDIGRTISGTGIPASATIIAINAANSVEISSAATANGNPVALTLGSNLGFLLTGQNAWIGSGTVATGHYRVSSTPGTVVACGVFGSDADCGTATTTMANTMVSMQSRPYTLAAIRYFDANGNNAYDGNDRVVLDVDGNNYVTPADVRLNTAGSQTFGARPTMSSSSEAHAILGLALMPKIVWLDSGTNPNQIDTTEPLALDIDGDLALEIGDICLMAIGSCSAGAQRLGSTTQPTTGGTWKDAAVTATNVGTLTYLDANNNGEYDLGDSLYIHFGTCVGTCTGAAGDLLIGSDSGASGSRATASPGTLKPFGAATYAALDVDGSGTYSVGDVVYIDRSNGVAGVADPGDIRMNSGSGLTGFGKNVKEGDADAVSVLINAAPSATPFSYRDFDVSPGFSLGDPVYLMPRATTCPLLGADVILSGGSTTATAGAFVGGSTAACTDLTAAPKFGYTPTGVYTTSAVLYLDMDGDGTVEIGDVRMAGITQGAAGTRVGGTATSDANTPLGVITIGAALGTRVNNVLLTFADASGDGLPSALETVILDIDGDLFFTPGDVALSTGTTTSTGGGGGGGTTTTPVTTTSSTVTTSATTTTSSATNTSSETTSASATSSGPAQLLEADLNELIQDSLDVDRQDGVNVITWDDVGADFYQVWSKDSPYVLQDELPGSQTSYTDAEGSSRTDYLVTACIGACTLTADDVNDGNVPGYDGVPKGEDATAPSGFIPGPSPVLLLGLVALAALLVRRRLA